MFVNMFVSRKLTGGESLHKFSEHSICTSSALDGHFESSGFVMSCFTEDLSISVKIK